MQQMTRVKKEDFGQRKQMEERKVMDKKSKMYELEMRVLAKAG